jgi:hypothetical protein
MKFDLFKHSPAPLKRAAWRARLRWPLVIGALLTLIAAGFLFAGDPKAVFALKMDAYGVKPTALLGAASLDPNDPALRFSQTHIGQVVFTTVGSDRCHRVLFDNRTGTSTWLKDVDCGRPAEQAIETAATPNRVLEVQKSFRR